jgi:hypothetical protein
VPADHGPIVENLGTEQHVVLTEAQDSHPGRINQPEVVAGHVEADRLIAGQVPDVLAHRHVDPCQVQAEPRVVAVRLGDHAHPLHPLPASRTPPHHRGPFLVPGIVRLTG